MVFHMRGHHGICKQMKPRDLSQLSAVLAMIRPAKRHLIGKSWSYVNEHVWTKPTDNSYYFKKSHSISYAMAVKLHMNLLVEQFSN
jgi:DNA polymerase III alpha subunit